MVAQYKVLCSQQQSPAALQVLLISGGNTAAILKSFVEATCRHFSLVHRWERNTSAQVSLKTIAE